MANVLTSVKNDTFLLLIKKGLRVAKKEESGVWRQNCGVGPRADGADT
jgi:hypothetical protein